jgi:hypothetical protein
MPGEIFGLMIELLHILWELFVELLDLLFEWVESTLDHVIEHLFETDLHDTQIIVFYIIMSICLFICYRLYRFLPKLFKRWLAALQAALAWHKTQLKLYWQGQKLTDKIKIVVMLVGVGYLLILFS